MQIQFELVFIERWRGTADRNLAKSALPAISITPPFSTESGDKRQCIYDDFL
jgi:hypothetical protein